MQAESETSSCAGPQSKSFPDALKTFPERTAAMTSFPFVRTRASCIALVIACGLIATPIYTQSADNPENVLHQYISAVNAGDLSRVRGLLAADFEMPQRWPPCAAEDLAIDCQLAKIKETLTDAKAVMEATNVRSTRDIVRANVTLTSDKIRASGPKRILVTDELLVDDGKIRSIITTLRTEDPDTAAYKRILAQQSIVLSLKP